MEAWDRGPAWREAIRSSLRSYDEDARAGLRRSLADGVQALGSKPGDYGVGEDDNRREAISDIGEEP